MWVSKINTVICETTRRHIPQDNHNHCCKNVKSDNDIVHRCDKVVLHSCLTSCFLRQTSACIEEVSR